LGKECEIIEAANGMRALETIRERNMEIDLMLLDIIMPELDGFKVLEVMNQWRWIVSIPVIMISAESVTSFVERAYELGVSDYISRPFDALIVRRRVVNTLMLYAKQKLMPEEFEVMKNHATVGAAMLKALPAYQDEALVKVAYETCRWHHERYDGRGYPDGLRGEDIPISAQIVSLADIYDALTSERRYKAALPHEKAVRMILDGACGAFHPLLIECLTEIAERIPAELRPRKARRQSEMQMYNVVEELLKQKDLGISGRALRLAEQEWEKIQFFASKAEEVRKAVERTVVKEYLGLGLSISIGGVHSVRLMVEAVKRADQRMYAAKTKRRGAPAGGR